MRLIAINRLTALLYVLIYLSNQAREDKDSCEEVDQLEDDLKERNGLGETPDSDQRTGGKIITAEIPWERKMTKWSVQYLFIDIWFWMPFSILTKLKKLL